MAPDDNGLYACVECGGYEDEPQHDDESADTFDHYYIEVADDEEDDDED